MVQEPERSEEGQQPDPTGGRIHVELAESTDGQKPDPVASVQSAQLGNLADAFRFQAELLDEMRGQLATHKEHSATQQQHLEVLAARIAEFTEFMQNERARAEEQRPPVGGKPKRPFGGPGF